MPNLLALSFEGRVAPSFDLKCLAEGRDRPDGWGLGYYPSGEPSVTVLKEPAPSATSIRSELVRAWEHTASSIFVLHIRHARWGSNTSANTQPFARHHGGQEWLFGHSGSLEHRLEGPKDIPFEPVGSTDTERLFCELLERMAKHGCRRIADVDPDLLASWYRELNKLGSLSSVLTDGQDLCVWADERGVTLPHVASFYPPYERAAFGDDDVELDLTKRGAMSRRGVIITSNPLRVYGDGRVEHHQVEPGQLILVRGGVVRHKTRGPESAAGLPQSGSLPVVPVGSRPQLPPEGEARYRIRHRTVYRYAKAVERSKHVLRLEPVHDRGQHVERFELRVSVPHTGFDFEDVFGNRTRRLLIHTAYNELSIESESVALVRAVDLSFSRRHVRSSIPLVWMPWQRHMLAPYLLPPELFESELTELTEYAMNFVRRNDSDLIDTLMDINQTIYREYKYEQGSTTLVTTPFDVYAHRKGVCQDFANLFICLARLLSVPARYVCGYVHVGGNGGDRQAMALASHAWVEVFLPDVGWRGFDPTNGTLAQTEHVRVAVGRTYRDATPTSGTIFVGGGDETLDVAVSVERLPDDG
jgi:transglutaminase-like putative cysteine protease/predicted glutamine amidotransferase